MKVLAWILTAAAILVGADVFVTSPDTAQPDSAVVDQREYQASLHGGSGMPPPPPD